MVPRSTVASTLFFGVLATGMPLMAAEYEIVPISSSGAHSINGNDITVQQGVQHRVLFDVFVRNWGPSELKAHQFGLDPAVYSTGLERPEVACADNAVCAAAFGPNAQCSATLPTCYLVWADIGRADWVYGGGTVIVASNDAPSLGAFLLNGGVADPGVRKYAGSLVVDVPPTATGTHDIEFLSSLDETFLADVNNVLILPLNLVIGRIIIQVPTGRCCFNIGPGTTQCIDSVESSACDAQPGPRTFTTNATCAQGCPQCVNDAQCADPNFCNGDERCLNGQCQSGTPVNCNDFNACTIDSCNEATDSCDHTPNPACFGSCCFNIGPGTTQCIDGVETNVCDAQPGPRAFTMNGTCAQGCPECVNDAQCADPVFCNGSELCENGQCQPSNFINCDDNNPCTIDSCVEDTDSCDHTPSQECLEDTGSCCNRTPSAGGNCTDGVRPDQCAGADQSWTRDGVCAQITCNEIGGACCNTLSGVCSQSLVTNCQGASLVWTREATCSQIACDPPPVSCCLPWGLCDSVALSVCEAFDGVVVPACLGDSNGNGLNDACDSDCDHDGILNVDEAANTEKDCNNNGTCDGVEIASCQPGCDCDGNGVLDSCETDCNKNGIKDSCDIAGGSSLDTNGNGTPDECEPDCDHDGIPDAVEIANCQPGDASCGDCNTDGIPDGCQSLGSCCYEPFGHPVCFMTSEANCAGWLIGGVLGGIWDACGNCDRITDAIEFNEGGVIFHHRVNAEEHCTIPGGLQQRSSKAGCSGPVYDAWVSRPGAGAMCEDFGTTESPALPADFFGPGSDPFIGTVCYRGIPLGLSAFGDADTLIARSADPFDRCALPSGADVQVTLDIADMHLQSVAPVFVTYNGGQTPEFWDVDVRLSSIIPASGSLTARKTHCNGGTYTNLLNVQPKLIFSKVGSPGTTVELDTGVQGMPAVVLASAGPLPWVHDVDPHTVLSADVCTDFHPGIIATTADQSCDCNGNGLRDTCDIESGFSQDCNGNGVPDTCDIDGGGSVDCNQNDVPDSCEPDCNANSVADACDISGGASVDTNANTIPDECERGVSAPSADVLIKNRYVSFRPGGRIDGTSTTVTQAFRVTSPNFPGLVKWVGPPDANNRIARLQCTPNFQVWGFGLVHVADLDIAPGKSYVVKGIAEGYPLNEEVSFSTPATNLPTTTKFGDIVAPIGIVNFLDISALVSSFQNKAGAPPRSVADIAPAIPDKLVSFLDIALDVTAFQNKPYPYASPTLCP